jgi:YgiT-type zinc finger domain-containing protein
MSLPLTHASDDETTVVTVYEPDQGLLGRGFPQEEKMRCIICKQADTQPGVTTVTLERGGATFVIKEVPAQICPNCGEDYVDQHVASELLRSAEAMARAGAQVDVRRYPVAA